MVSHAGMFDAVLREVLHYRAGSIVSLSVKHVYLITGWPSWSHYYYYHAALGCKEIDIQFIWLFIVSCHVGHQIYSTTRLHNRSLQT